MKNKLSFRDMYLIPELEKAIEKQGYTVPTPIQKKSIPGLLVGRDLIGIAQTGTGKTAAFLLPILQKMTETHPRKINTLIIAPTRELAAQIGDSIKSYGRYLKYRHTVVFGGVGQGQQVQALNNGVNIVVATPGRLLDLLNQRKLNLNDIEFFVLDEADRMLDMGFIHDIKKIIQKLPAKRQSFFFSATMSPQINQLAKSLLKNPIHVEVTPAATTVEIIEQSIYFVDKSNKERLLLEILNQKNLNRVLIFTRTKRNANKVAQFLNQHNISADAIHGNKSQTARTKALRAFKTGYTKVLVATDIAARGIDIDQISHVINYELPNEPESYVHRIGRTARAGKDGIAISFCEAKERNFLRSIERLIKQKIEVKRHHLHSDQAQYATGEAAKPAPRQFFNRSGFKRNSGFSSKSNKNNSGNKYYRRSNRGG